MKVRHDSHADVARGIGDHSNDLGDALFLAEIHHFFNEGRTGEIHFFQLREIDQQAKALLQPGHGGARALQGFLHLCRGDVPTIAHDYQLVRGICFDEDHALLFHFWGALPKQFGAAPGGEDGRTENS